MLIESEKERVALAALTKRFGSLSETVDFIADLEASQQQESTESHAMISEEKIRADYQRELKKIKRMYQSFPFKKGYKLNTSKDHLKDLFHRFHQMVLNLEESEIDNFVEQILKEQGDLSNGRCIN